MQSDAWRGFRWLVPRRYGLANICGFLARGFGVSCECKSLWHTGEQGERDVSFERMLVSFNVRRSVRRQRLTGSQAAGLSATNFKHLYIRYVSLLFGKYFSEFCVRQQMG